MNFFNSIRLPAKQKSACGQMIVTLLILLLGICLGLFSKYLDYRQAELPSFLMAVDAALDFHDFLGGFAPWILLAVCIAIYSKTPLHGAINVFVFFVGMVGSYYWYSEYVAGFFPRSYAMIWAWCTVLSPFFAVLCWYAKGKGWISCLLAAGIIGVLFNTAFVYGMIYFDVTSWLNVLMLGIALFVLRREKKEMLLIIGFGIIFAMAINVIIPFRIW